ncbi:MAG: beta strand repeat-containing protein, partial [Candidatus Paceibacterota bacterium]
TLFTATGQSTLANASTTGLTSSGTLNVTGQTVLANASTTGLTSSGTLNVTGKTTLTTASTTILTATDLFASGNFAVTGTTNLTGKLTATTASTTILTATGLFSSGNLNVASISTLTGAVNASSTLAVTGATTLYSTLNVTGQTTLTTASTTGLTSSGTLNVTGQTVLGNASTTGLTSSGTLNSAGTTTLASGSGAVAVGGVPIAAFKLSIYAGQSDGVWVTPTSGATTTAILNNMVAGAWNNLVKNGDTLLLNKASGVDSADTGGIVLGTWTAKSVGLRIDRGGNVGIATSTAGSLLTVASSTATGTSGLFEVGTTTTIFSILANGAATLGGPLTVSGNTLLATAGGNVGIGTTTPTSQLGVSGTSAYAIFYNTANNRSTQVGVIDGFNGGITQSSGSIDLKIGGTSFLSLGTSGGTHTVFGGTGNVGIGSTTPGTKFTVVGSGYFGGNLVATGTLDVTGATTLSSTLGVTGTSTLATTTASALGINLSGSAPTALLHIGGTYTTTNSSAIIFNQILASNVTGQQNIITAQSQVSPTGASLSALYGILNLPTLASSAAPVTNVYANFARIDTAGTYTGLISSASAFQAGTPSIAGSFPITSFKQYGTDVITNGNATTTGTINNFGFLFNGATAAATGTATINNYGFFSTVPSGSPTAGTNNNYGLYISGNGGTATVNGTANNYSIYNTSTANTYFAGNVGMGESSPQTLLTVGTASPGTAEATNKGKIQIAGGVDINAGASGLEFKGSASGSGYGWKVATPDRGSGNVPLSFAYRATSATWTELVTMRGDTGNVGIGTTTPATKLHVQTSSGNADVRVQVSDASTSNPQFSLLDSVGNGWVTFQDNADSDKYKIGKMVSSAWSATYLTVATTGNVGIGTTTSGSVLGVASSTATGTSGLFEVGTSTTVMSVLANGNVGIGTSAPVQKLTIHGGTSNSTIGFSNTTTGVGSGGYIGMLGGNDIFYVNQTAAGNLYFGTNNTTRAIISAAGNFGIGTTSPTALLTVASSTATGTTGLFEVGTTGTLLKVLASGNVGIGSTTPTSLLTVASSTASGTSRLVSVGTTTSLFNILANGNVGIGTSTTPLSTLTVGNTPGLSGKLLTVSDMASPYTGGSASGIAVSLSGGGGIYMNAGGSGGVDGKYEAYGGELGVGTISAHPLVFYSNNLARMQLLSSGVFQWGMGEAGTPSAFTIRGAAGSGTDVAGADITFDASNGTGGQSSGAFVFRTATSTGHSTFDATSTKVFSLSANTATTTTWSHTVTSSGSDRILIVTTAYRTTSTTTVTGVTYNGVAMTGLATSSSNGWSNSYANKIWYLLNPATGANTVSATITGGSSQSDIHLSATSFTEVNQSTPFGTFASSSPSGTVSTVSLDIPTTSTGNVVFTTILTDANNRTLSVPNPQRETIELVGTNNTLGSSYGFGTAATTSVTWTISSGGARAFIMGVELIGTNTTNVPTLASILRIGTSTITTAAVNVGIGTSTPGSRLDIWNDNPGVDDLFRIGSGSNILMRVAYDGRLFTDGSVTTGNPADLAESYTATEAVDAGTVVAFSTSTTAWSAMKGSATSTAEVDDVYDIAGVRKARSASEAIGVISTNPGLHMGASIINGVPVALAGRVPVKVTTQNGVIKSGDYLTVSTSTPGYAMKLTGSGKAIGRAISDYVEGRDKVMMAIENGYQAVDMLADNATTTLLTSGNLDLDANGVAIINIKSLASANGTWSIDENGRIVAKVFCLEDVCIDKTQLTNILNSTGQSGVVAGTSTGSTGGDMGTTTPDTTATTTEPDPTEGGEPGTGVEETPAPESEETVPEEEATNPEPEEQPQIDETPTEPTPAVVVEPESDPVPAPES